MNSVLKTPSRKLECLAWPICSKNRQRATTLPLHFGRATDRNPWSVIFGEFISNSKLCFLPFSEGPRFQSPSYELNGWFADVLPCPRLSFRTAVMDVSTQSWLTSWQSTSSSQHSNRAQQVWVHKPPGPLCDFSGRSAKIYWWRQGKCRHSGTNLEDLRFEDSKFKGEIDKAKREGSLSLLISPKKRAQFEQTQYICSLSLKCTNLEKISSNIGSLCSDQQTSHGIWLAHAGGLSVPQSLIRHRGHRGCCLSR